MVALHIRFLASLDRTCHFSSSVHAFVAYGVIR
jgi:hypothetical protein